MFPTPDVKIFFEPKTTDDGSLICVSKKSPNYGHSRTTFFDGKDSFMWVNWEFPVELGNILMFSSYDDEKQPFAIKNYRQELVN